MMATKTLSFVLKGRWYDMIKSGEKPEEYRKITPYWLKRIFWYNTNAPFRPLIPIKDDFWKDFLPADANERIKALKHLLKVGVLVPKHNKATLFHGYAKNRPFENRKIKGIVIGQGRPEWGAEPGTEYFVIKLKQE